MFKEIQLSGFRGIKRSNGITLAPMTVFTGREGSGKSTIGHFLTMLKQTVMTADSNVVLYPGDKDSLIRLGTQSSLRYSKDESLTFSYRFDLPEYLLVEDPEKDKFDVPTQFLYGENIKFECVVDQHEEKHPFVSSFSYELYEQNKKVMTAITRRDTYETKKGTRIQYPVETEGYELKNRTGRPWLQKPPHHFYGFSEELNTYYKNVDGLFSMAQAHENLLRNIYYVGSDRARFNALHLWSGLKRFDVGHNGAHTITALLGASNREISLGERKRNQAVDEIIDGLLQRMGLLDKLSIHELEAIEHGYAVEVSSYKSKRKVELTEAGHAVSQVLPILVQCFCAPHNSVIVLEGVETHLSNRAQALLADVLLDVIQSKEDGVDRNIQLIISTQSEAFLRRLQRRVAQGEIPVDAVQAYHTSNFRSGIRIESIPFIDNGSLHDLTKYFSYDEDERMHDIVIKETLETLPKRDLEAPIKPKPKKVVKQSTRGPGRPKGSKNKPKSDDDKPKRGPGRPKGSKNKPKKDEAEKPKRGPGRPKGSKNKPKSNDDKPKRGPGRPKGSKNKPKKDEAEKPKRGPGRPKGSKNKKTEQKKEKIRTKSSPTLTSKPVSEKASATRLKNRHKAKTTNDES